MTGIFVAVSVLLMTVFALFCAGRFYAWRIARLHPPQGRFVTVNGTAMHHVLVPEGDAPDLPPLVFIHGASGNLLDQMVPIRPLLEGRARMLFPDRPGHGWSARGPGNGDPFAQARTIAALMDQHGMEQAVVVGHSFGGAVAAALALEYPQRVRGLVFVSAATHPWPGKATSWYYALAARPLVGPVFVGCLAWLGGAMRIERASACVFSPNSKPSDYVERAAIRLVLRPGSFRWNAIDVAGLYDHVETASKRYGEIEAPSVVISGNRDCVVYEEIHSVGLARDIAGAQLVWVDNLGHKPDWVAPDLIVAAIEQVSGLRADVRAVARAVESRLSGNDYGPLEACMISKPELARSG